MLGDFEKAADSIISSCAGGTKKRTQLWNSTNVITSAVALWEVENYTKWNGALKGLDLTAFNKAREVMGIRTKKIAKMYDMTKPVKNLPNFFAGFSEFRKIEELELDMFAAQQTEIIIQVKIAKFYWVLAKCAYEERERRGIGKDKKGKKKGFASAKVGQAEGLTGAEEVIILEGENLKMMEEAMEGFKEIEMGLFSELNKKRVAIDYGVSVVFRWGVEEAASSRRSENSFVSK